jgi:REP-associated tyrosine transposase
MSKKAREHPPHFPPIERYNTAIIVFLTVCTKNRKPILADPAVKSVLVRVWQTHPAWLVGRYVIMPTHVHLFCAPAEFSSPPLSKWVGFWKSLSTQRWPHQRQRPVWQRHFWDTQLRRGQSYDDKWDYVVANPVRAGLASRAEDWPFHGELNILRW